MMHDERVARLKSMLSQIAGPDGMESLAATPPSAGFENLSESAVDVRLQLSTALRKLERNQPLTPDEAFGLEAIVLPDKRPVVYIRNSVFDPVPMDDWAHLNKPAVHALLDPLFPSIGRVELLTTPTVPYGGTAFVVGPNLLMTNRHVARLFAEGLGTHLSYHAGASEIDFKQEEGTPTSDTSARVTVHDVVMIHPYWDMALLEVTGLPMTAAPLKLSVKAPEECVGQDVVVVGYPARDYRNPYAVQDRIFQNKYGVKRMQPGKVRPRSRIQSFENEVDAMTHDSSTLGGNSGSALIEVATGTVVGLHFAGEYLKANYAVPTYELARDPRVVQAGLNFKGIVTTAASWVGVWPGAGGRAEINKPDPLPVSNTGQQPQIVPGAALNAAASFVIPLHLTIAIGQPVAAGATPVTIAVPAVTTTPPAVPAATVEKVPVIHPNLNTRQGYQEDFLDLDDGTVVPLPQLTVAGKSIAAKLEDGSTTLHYHRFTIVMHKKRRLALFTAANVDWRPEKHKVGTKKPTRKQLNGFTGDEREDWVIDPRLPFDQQLPDYFYTRDSGAFDRGHLVRRDDVAWGDSFADMQMGNGDTFHTTNCSPQTAEFNRPNPNEFNWGALEEFVEKETNTEKVCIFSGPVLDDKDQYFHGLVKSGVKVSIQIPRKFWKIIVANNDGAPAAYGFVLDQDLSGVDLHAELAVPEGWKRFMRPLAEIEGHLRGLAKLGPIKKWDVHER